VAALVALLLGSWATVRHRRLAGGIVAIALGLSVIGYLVFFFLTYKED
jgi:hypothetical protein